MPSSADSRTWPRRLTRSIAWAGGGLLTLVLAAYAAFPWLSSALAPRLAVALGVDLLELEVRRPGLTALTVERLRMTSGRVEVSAADACVAFRPLALLRGQVESVAVARLTLRVAEVPVPAQATAAAPIGLPAPDTWLAAVPAEQVSVAALEVAVPALGFRADGGLELEGPALLLHLTGRTPAAAQGMMLAASLTRDGRVGASLTAPGADGVFVALTSAVESAAGGERLGVRGSLDLRGFPLQLARSLAGLPAGDGRVAGSFAATLPWPPPETPDWTSPVGSGRLTIDWRPEAGDWRLDGATASWQIEAGRLSAQWNGTVPVAEQTLAVAGRLQDWQLPAAGGAGELSVALANDTNERPVLQTSWRQAVAALVFDGVLQIQDRSFDLLTELTGLARGDGRMQVAYDARLPWPVETGPLTLAGLGITAEGSVGGSWQPDDAGPSLRRIDGRWRLDAGTLAGDAEAEIGYRGLRAGLDIDLDRLAFDGSLAAAGALGFGEAGAVTFAVGPAATGAAQASLRGSLDAGAGDGLLDSVVSDWPGEFDATAGSIGLDAELTWRDTAVLGDLQLDLSDVSAYYQSYRLAGLNSTLEFSGTAGGWHLPVTPVFAARIDTGVELRDLDSGIGWRGDRVEVQATTAALLGGTASIEPFEYRLDTGAADFRVTFDDIDLARVLALQGEQVQGSGTLDGGLPIRIEQGQPSISGGRVHADAPGGMLRVSQSLASGTGQPGLDFALRALQNFDYSVLTADVDYAADGDLTLAVHLEGRNPDIEQGRPIHYNVTVNQNLPVLLESLRLQQNVTRSIERRLNN